jgi:serine/threonine protein kinase
LFLIKQIKKSEIEQIGFEFFKTSFINEIKALDTMKHPNIESLVSVYHEQLQEDIRISVVVNYCSKKSLLDMMNDHIRQRKRIEDKELNTIMKVLIDTVFKMKNLNIIHRNLSVESIFLGKEDNLYTLSVRNFYFSTITTTPVKGLYGALWSMAPEMLRESEYDSKVDVWSLGLIFYMLVTLENPFRHAFGKEEVLEAMRNEDCIKPIKYLSKLGHNVECLKLIREMMLDDCLKRTSLELLFEYSFFKSEDKSEAAKNMVRKYYLNFPENEENNKLKELKDLIKCIPKLHELIVFFIYNLRDFFLSIEDISTLNEIFKHMDSNNDGQISSTEIRDNLKSLKINHVIATDYSELLFTIIDTNFRKKFVKSYLLKTIDYDYFIVANIIVSLYLNKDNKSTNEKIRLIFRELDKDESQSISIDEIRSHFTGKYIINVSSEIDEIENHPMFDDNIKFDNISFEQLKKIFLYDCFNFEEIDDDSK